MSAAIVWMASYPKSGNTWLRAVYSAWRTGRPVRLNDLMAEGGAARFTFDDAAGILSAALTGEEVELLRPRVDELLAREAKAPLARKTHDTLAPGPAGEPAISAAATRAALYVVRDPRDVAVSLAHHQGRPIAWAVDTLENPDAKMGESIEAPVPQLLQRIGTWSEHVRSWVDDPPFPVHVLRYEDCIATPVKTFGRVLGALNLEPVDEGDVARAVERASFDRLAAAEADEGFRERPETSARFFRHGRAGSWRDELDPALTARVETAHGETMARFGYL